MRLFRLAFHATHLFFRPDHLPAVFGLVDTLTTPEVLEAQQRHLASSVLGSDAQSRQLRLGAVDVSQLAHLPEGTFGRAFADFVQARGIDPTVLTDRATTADAWYAVHMYEVHDLWHVLLGIDTDPISEVKLQAFSAAQHPFERLAPMTIGIALLKSAVVNAEFAPSDVFDAVATGYALGSQVQPLVGIDWSARWEQPLAALRAELGVTPTALAA